MIKVSKHKGRSGVSVYEWRVYRITQSGIQNAMTRSHQLGKYRTRKEAEYAAEHYRASDARVAYKSLGFA